MSILGSIARSSSQRATSMLDSLSRSSAAELGWEAAAMARKLARSSGKAAWLAGTTFLVLGIPLLFAMEREMAINEMEYNEQAEIQALLGTSRPPA
ncbi:mitochondrial import receptor subunit TOM9-2-like [Phragmites australis]|uniref:mitochondrial import receptor subunit TOM9-2-like n=1 Tax=Phragmites australis TaxID=29695 RepID=UPI002D7A0AB5|nr:mitochondrial import receptor subunit TOM9-2-like [Phragmites australis]